MDEKLDKKESELAENNAVSVVSVRPKQEKVSPLYLVLLIVLIPGIIALGVIGFKKLASLNGGEDKDGGKTVQTLPNALLSDEFITPILDEGKWTTSVGGDRSQVTVENGKLRIVEKPSSFQEGGPESWAVISSKQMLPGDYEIETTLDFEEFTGAAKVMVVLQNGSGLPKDYMGVVFDQGYLGTNAKARRVLGNESVDLGTKLFERELAFKVKIVKVGGVMSMYVNDDLLGSTGKFFMAGLGNISLAVLSDGPDFPGVKASFDKISVSNK
jgi:hypothetical protein